jgi:hypothetical protein
VAAGWMHRTLPGVFHDVAASDDGALRRSDRPSARPCTTPTDRSVPSCCNGSMRAGRVRSRRRWFRSGGACRSRPAAAVDADARRTAVGWSRTPPTRRGLGSAPRGTERRACTSVRQAAPAARSGQRDERPEAPRGTTERAAQPIGAGESGGRLEPWRGADARQHVLDAAGDMRRRARAAADGMREGAEGRWVAGDGREVAWRDTRSDERPVRSGTWLVFRAPTCAWTCRTTRLSLLVTCLAPPRPSTRDAAGRDAVGVGARAVGAVGADAAGRDAVGAGAAWPGVGATAASATTPPRRTPAWRAPAWRALAWRAPAVAGADVAGAGVAGAGRGGRAWRAAGVAGAGVAGAAVAGAGVAGRRRRRRRAGGRAASTM